MPKKFPCWGFQHCAICFKNSQKIGFSDVLVKEKSSLSLNGVRRGICWNLAIDESFSITVLFSSLKLSALLDRFRLRSVDCHTFLSF